MGTRSTVKFIETFFDRDTQKKVERPICSMYSQFDGYMSGMGRDLGEFLVDIKVVNGLSGDSTNTANGMGCLSAQFIQHIKDGAGGHYMTNLEDSQEYNYEVVGGYDKNMSPIQPIVRVFDYEGVEIFNGTPVEFISAKYNKMCPKITWRK